MTSSSNSSSPEQSQDETALVESSSATGATTLQTLNNRLSSLAKKGTRTGGELATKTIRSSSAAATTLMAPSSAASASTSSSSSLSSCCCCWSRKCACVGFILAFALLDVFLNAFFVTYSFTRAPDFALAAYDIRMALVDIWVVSLVRDSVLLVVVLCTLVRHQLVYRFIRAMHRSYLTAFLCLVMYSFAMGRP